MDELIIPPTEDDTTDEFTENEIAQDVLNELNTNNDTVEEIVKEETVTKKKTKKKKICDPFIVFCKTYLSSLVARSSKYGVLYLDTNHEDCFVLVSSKNKLTFEDYLLQYTPGDLGVHIVRFKDNSFNAFRETIQAYRTTTLLNIPSIRSAINAICKDKELVGLPIKFTTDKNNHSLYLQYKDISKTNLETNEPLTIIERFGIEYTDWRTICILRDIVSKMESMEHNKNAIVKEITYKDIIQYINQNLLFYPINTKEYIDKGYPIFEQYTDTHKTPLIYVDGKDIVSIKEYVKKQKGDYSLKIVSVVNAPNLQIDYCSIYEDDFIHVVSSRPFTSTYPHVISAKETKDESDV